MCVVGAGWMGVAGVGTARAAGRAGGAGMLVAVQLSPGPESFAGGLVRVNIAKETVSRFTGPGARGILADPSVSPSGRQLLATRTETSGIQAGPITQRVVSARISGSRLLNPHYVTAAPSGRAIGSGAPAWAPSGREFSFFTYPAPDGGGLATAAANGDHARLLVPSVRGAIVGAPASWTRTGIFYVRSAIAGPSYFRGTSRSDGEVYRVSPGSRVTERILGGENAWPSASPSGRYVAVCRGSSSSTSIFIEDLRSGSLRRVTRGGLDIMPSWAPDGRRIAFVRYTARGPEIALLDVKSGRVRVLHKTLGRRLLQPVFIAGA